MPARRADLMQQWHSPAIFWHILPTGLLSHQEILGERHDTETSHREALSKPCRYRLSVMLEFLAFYPHGFGTETGPGNIAVTHEFLRLRKHTIRDVESVTACVLHCTSARYD